MKHNTHKKGFTLIELLVVMSIIALLLSILMPALGRARAEAMLTKDQTQVKAVYSGFSFWAPSHNGKYPIPGLEKRMPDPGTGNYIKGRGPEDLFQNDHASMYSMCIMQQLFTADILIAPTEQGEYVAVSEAYDYDVYNASANQWMFWDEEFGNDLNDSDATRAANNSYACIPITGKRKHQNWGISTHNPTGFSLVGTRGPVDGIEDPYSVSNFFHGIDRSWKGVHTFGDGHTEILETFYPIASTYLGSMGDSVADNIFMEDVNQPDDPDYGSEQGQLADIILTHVMKGDVDDNGKGGSTSVFNHD